MTISLLTQLLMVLCLSGLITCIIVLRQRNCVSAAQIARLEEILTRLTREELGSGARISRVERLLKATRERQEALASRALGARIQSAVRIARRGAASERMLRDLGLSAGEASLLMRLHPGATSDTAAKAVAAAIRGDTPARSDGEPPPTAVAARCASSGRQHSQAATLARLLARSGPVGA